MSGAHSSTNTDNAVKGKNKKQNVDTEHEANVSHVMSTVPALVRHTHTQ